MNIHTDTRNLFENSLKVGSALFLMIGASLVIPKIAGAAMTLNHTVPKYTIPATQNRLEEYKANSQDSLNGYEPPDFGRPSSAYGSGTR